MNRQPLLTYRQRHPDHLEYEASLRRLYRTDKERARSDGKWTPFLTSSPCNERISELNGNRLTYSTEHLIPKNKDDRPSLVLVLGIPATHSVVAEIFVAFRNSAQSRSWKGDKGVVKRLNYHCRVTKRI